jgi:acetaldehyde dehydrogenase (acetylating)
MEFDKDLAARQEARLLSRQAATAAQALRRMSQAQLDAITEAVARRFSQASQELAELAVQETGFGNTVDKTTKNRFASEQVLQAMRDMQCVGVLKEDPAGKLWQIGVPVGVIAAIVPSTNPTSTVCYKALIALKSGNAIIFSPHPKALKCTLQAAQIVAAAAESAGAPAGSVSCLTLASMDGTQELMTAPEVKLILATGGPGMVRAAYSSGKPAIGVGAGNGPAYIHPDADMEKALDCILRSKNFDFGTVCASEQSILVQASCVDKLKTAAASKGFYFMSQAEAEALGKLLFKPNGGLSPDVVGKSALHLAKIAGFSVPQDTKILVAQADRVGPKYPYSMEKLCPVLALFVEQDVDGVLRKAVEVLSYEGSGHTFCMHCQDSATIHRFAAEIPVSRFLVNTPAALGGIGYSTGLFPALTLGCGAVGGSSSSNNISPMDLINIRNVAWDTEKQPQKNTVDAKLIDLLTAKILERLK